MPLLHQACKAYVSQQWFARMLSLLTVYHASDCTDNAAKGVPISYARNAAMSGIPMIAKLMIQARVHIVSDMHSCRNK